LGTIPRFDLRNAALFAGINGCAIADLLAVAQHKDTLAGSSFFHEDDPAIVCHLLIKGHVKLIQHNAEGSQVVVRFVAPGQMFGWASVLGGSHYPASAEALTDSVALIWDNQTIRRAIMAHPALALNALAIMGGRLREAEDRLRELATERVERRLARALLRLAEQSGLVTAKGTEITFPVSRQILADTTGATLHTISRILSNWDQRGLTGGGRQKMLLLRLDRIADLAESEDVPS
jgi:CRP-like cAMP-binding protein